MKKSVKNLKICILSIVSIMVAIFGFSFISASADTKTAYVNLIKPDTEIILPATMIAEIKGDSDIDYALGNAHIAIVDIDKDLNVSIGSSVMAFSEFYTRLGNKLIPALRVKDKETVAGAVAYLKTNSIKDAYIISDNWELLAPIRTDYKILRSVLDLSVSNLTNKEMAALVNKSGSKIVILPESKMNEKDMDYFRMRYITVWTKGNDLSKTEKFSLILNGTQGIISTELNLYRKLMKDFDKRTLVRKPVIIGHRGTPDLAVENTMSGFKMAQAKGSKMVELDIHLSKDGHLVVMHDADLSRMTGYKGNIVDMTLEEIKSKKYIKAPKETIPTLNEVLDEFASLDAIIAIEIKGYSSGIEAKLVEVLKEKDAVDRVTIISFSSAHIAYIAKNLSEASVGLLGPDINRKVNNVISIDASLTALYNLVGAVNSTYNPSKAYFDNSVFLQAGLRGVMYWPWTYDSKLILNRHIMNGVSGVTINNMDWMSDEIMSVSADIKYDMKVGDVFNNDIKALTYSGSIKKVSEYLPLIINGSETVEIKDGKLTAVKAGSADVIFGVKISTGDTNRPDYYIYSKAVTINVAAAAVIVDETNNGGCKGKSGTASAVILSSFAALAFLSRRIR